MGEPKVSAGVRMDRGLLFILSLVLVGVTIAHQADAAHFDFGVFYFASHMVFAGAGQSLYDLATQHAFQTQFHRAPELLFCHPPFVLIPFLLIDRLPVWAAFLIWAITSLALLFFSIRMLSQAAELRYGNWPVLAAFAFLPVIACLANGQLSMVVLCAYVWTYAFWQKERRFLGGLALGLATFKFQLVIGFIAILLLKRKWRELLGFATGSLLLLLLSIPITGVPGLLRYSAFLSRGDADSGAKLNEMPCWRGLLSLGGADHLLVVAAFSLLTILVAARCWRDLDTGFVAAVLASMLVSYHFNPTDLSLFLIPALLAARVGFPKERLPQFAFGVLVIQLIPGLLGGNYALLAVPLAACLWWLRDKTLNRNALTSPRTLAAA